MKKAVILINDTTYAYILRGAVLQELVLKGFEAVVVGKQLKHVEKLRQIGCRLINVNTDRHHVNPLSDLSLFIKYLHILKTEKPDVVLTYNIKPNVYGGYACKRLRIPYIANVTGLGTPLGRTGIFQRFACILYKQGISGAKCVFFQNELNRQFFIQHGMLNNKEQSNAVLPGSGVDLQHYEFSDYPEDKEIHFLFAARIMKEKGIDLYLEAAKQFSGEKVIFDVCGPCENKHYRYALESNEYIIYHGEQNDLRPFYQKCSCFVFPSNYPEGMSNVLLEAASSGRPIITTNNPGCAEIVENGVNGYIVPVNDQESLNDAIKRFLSLSFEEKKSMGLSARKMVEEKFSRAQVVKQYMGEINRILAGKHSSVC